MEFFSGILVGLIIGVVMMCLLSVIPNEEDEFEMDIEEKDKEQ